MKYLSTRGRAPRLTFDDVLIGGLAPDGGLYVPERWPVLAEDLVHRAADLPYHELAVEVTWPFVEGSIERAAYERLVEDAYSRFDHPDVTPAVELANGLWVLELFHGPTHAFKDLALQLVGPLLEHELAQRGTTATILVATSGDTGAAAIEAVRDREGIEIYVLHPEGRVSAFQRRQMTTVDSPNVHNLAVEGTFDDCQRIVKALFADAQLKERRRLTALNSINWARVMAQTVYYVAAWARLGGGPIAFTVPTGNFGNVYAGWVARRMGVPIRQLVIASNANDMVTRWVRTGVLEPGEVVPTYSPAMDIQVPSNLERLLFELVDRDGAAVADLLAELDRGGRAEVGLDRQAGVAEVFDAASFDDDATLAEMTRVNEQHGQLVDPHTAVGVAAARECRRDPTIPMVVLSTAHPVKFAEAVKAATGTEAAPTETDLPERLVHVRDEHEVREIIS